MVCPICGAQLEENAKECFVCGYCMDSNGDILSDKVSDCKICPICNSIINEGDSICPLCGAPIEVSSELESSLEECGNETASDEEEYDDETDDEEESGYKRKHSKKPVIIILALILLLVIGIVLLFMLKDNKSDKKTVADTTKKSATEQAKSKAKKKDTKKKSDDMESINEKDYLGYWNIKDNTTIELAINNITSDKVQFTLYHKLDSIENVIALLDGNVASFSDNSGKGIVKGNLTFEKSFITLHIVESDQHPYIHVGTQKFDSRHKESWQSSENSTNEPAEASTNTNVNEPTAHADVEPYTVKITAPSVTIYSGPGKSYSIVDTITGGETYTIVAEARDAEYNWWGKLKSGVGWINLLEVDKESFENYSSDYILPDSSSRQLTYEDVKYLSGNELLLARNEIYARHGRIFEDADIRTYFESQPWYSGTIEPANFSDSLLSELEKSNVAFIKMYE